MKKSIIEKLGISPGPWEDSEGMGFIFANRIGGCNMDLQRMTAANTRGHGCLIYHGEEKCHAEMEANEHLIAAAPEMLEALIELHDRFENSKDWGNADSKYYALMQITRPIVEKATGKSWPEIKELIK